MSLGELIEKAVKLENESISLFEEMKKMFSNSLFQNRLDFIISEEKMHVDILKDVLSKRGKIIEPVEKSGMELEGKTKVEILQYAMDHELESRLLYIKIYDEIPEEDTELRKLFYYLVRMELTHYQILEAELECLVRYEECEKYYPETKEVKE